MAVIRNIIKEILALSVVSVVLAFAVNTLSPRGIALAGDWDVKKGVVTARAKDDAVDHSREIELLQAKEYFEKGVLFVDARTKEDYASGHIRGAVSLSVETIWENFGKFKNQYPETTLVVTYCSGRECSDSHDLARYLSEVGYKNVRVFADGFPLWEKEKLPVEK